MYKNINNEYIGWFNGKNESLKYSRHYKKKYSRGYLIKNYFKLKKSNNFFLAIFDKRKKLLVGTMIINKDMKRNGFNVGIFLGNKKYNSKGYAYESIKLFIKFAFKKLKIRSISAGTDTKNIPMIKLMKRLKMKKLPRKNSKSVIFEIKNKI